jgi:hypothetical protein
VPKSMMVGMVAAGTADKRVEGHAKGAPDCEALEGHV